MDTTLPTSSVTSTRRDTTRIGRAPRIAGHVLSALVALLLTADAAAKLAELPEVAAASAQLGLPPELPFTLGLVLLGCVALYVFPRTAVLGAVLLTGYLGGAIAVHARIGDPLFSHTLFPIYVGVMVWGGLYLRDRRVRAAIGPVRPEHDRE